ncbi:MAG: error-prone DNA polymerase [Phycisphaerales bacterium]|nr:error-prone DNA polymerase [Phycisphaerales bacterium]
MSAASQAAYCELEIATAYSFLCGASLPESYVHRAAELGYTTVGITDDGSVGGLVRAHVAGRETGVRVACGARLRLAVDAQSSQHMSMLVYATDRSSWGGLCRLLTSGRRRAAKGEYRLTLSDLVRHHDGLLAILLPGRGSPPANAVIERLCDTFDDDRLSMSLHRHLDGDDDTEVMRRVSLASRFDVPVVATNDVRFHVPSRRRLHDVMTCIRLHCRIDDAGTQLLSNSERYLQPPQRMAERFASLPEAIDRSVVIATRATENFSLDRVRYRPPGDVCPEGMNENDRLRSLVDEGLRRRGGAESIRPQIDRECELIAELGYASYFLTVHDIVRFARGRGILCQGRGSAANSAVCWALGITAVDPARGNLLFERFLSRERGEPPDIDIDFEHDRREEVIQYIYRRYGRDRAALCATVITWRWRSAIREVGRVLGLSLDVIERLAKGGREGASADTAPSEGVVSLAIELATAFRGLPRHRSQHVGGFVITADPLEAIVPIENAAMDDRTVIEWDKDDLEAMGLLKIDVLGLGMLSCIRRCLDEVGGDPPMTLASIPAEDPDVYDMCCRADTVGVFQIESRAQMAMLPRLQPRCFYDLVIEIALVRPGPIQGGMVHPYLRRREGREAITYPNDAVRHVLERTLGVPIFQEQAMRLAMVAGGFTADEAERLRRAMGAWKRRPDTMQAIGGRLIDGMRARGYDQSFIDRCWRQIHGFSEYGFPESHSVSFALLVYASAWLKHHHPAAFACSLLNSQPMGFYAPAQIVRDAVEHGVTVRPVDVAHSRVGCTLEDQETGSPSLRLGLRMVRGLSRDDATLICAAAASGAADLQQLHAFGVGPGALRAAARADAFGSMGFDRQSALWEIRLIERGVLPLFPAGSAPPRVDPARGLPKVALDRQVRDDYQATGLSLKAHPVSFLRTWLETRGASTAESIRAAWPQSGGQPMRAAVGGLVLVRQRPHSAKGMTFMTVEDETGAANIVITPPVYRRCRAAIRLSPFVLVYGTIERRGEVVHLKAEEVVGCTIGPAVGEGTLYGEDQNEHDQHDDRDDDHQSSLEVRCSGWSAQHAATDPGST